MNNLTREEMQIAIVDHTYQTMDETLIAEIVFDYLMEAYDTCPEAQIIHEYNTILGE